MKEIYRREKAFFYPKRTWSNKEIMSAPIWCAVDPRDGNQAIYEPMDVNAKTAYFKMLVGIGVKEIEIGFPSASETDFNFVRYLINENLIPEDVWIMVLTPCRNDLIEKTMKSLEGVKKAIVHAYLPTSDLHLQQVLNLSRVEGLELVKKSVKLIKEMSEEMSGSEIRFEFSPEEFSDTDIDFALEVFRSAFDTWGKASKLEPMIFNLPATVERRPPNQFADMVEYLIDSICDLRDRVIVSVHCHNDMGMSVAATELALLAGADRVEGTLFGNGERAGNTCLVTVANNIFVRGIETGLDFSQLPELVSEYERLTKMKVDARHPYAGELVFTSFSGSHQDAIRKVWSKLAEQEIPVWKMPYLICNPESLGRSCEKIIRANGQSGKAALMWILEKEHGLSITDGLARDLMKYVQTEVDRTGKEIKGSKIYEIFISEFVHSIGEYELLDFCVNDQGNYSECDVTIKKGSLIHEGHSSGEGSVEAFINSLRSCNVGNFEIGEGYTLNAISKGESAKALACVPLVCSEERIVWGVGIDSDIVKATALAVISALNRGVVYT